VLYSCSTYDMSSHYSTLLGRRPSLKSVSGGKTRQMRRRNCVQLQTTPVGGVAPWGPNFHMVYTHRIIHFDLIYITLYPSRTWRQNHSLATKPLALLIVIVIHLTSNCKFQHTAALWRWQYVLLPLFSASLPGCQCFSMQNTQLRHRGRLSPLVKV